jgi:hypothetical protein
MVIPDHNTILLLNAHRLADPLIQVSDLKEKEKYMIKCI